MAKYKVNIPVSTLVPGGQNACLLQQSAAHCTRCNSCLQSCPAYLLNPQETFSPRGRVQLIRLLSEGKISLDVSDPLLKEIAFSCTLCARCTAACAGQIPVAHHMLALRNALEKQPLPDTLRLFLFAYGKYPGLFHWITCSGLFLRRLGFANLLRPLLPKWLKHAQAILPAKTGSFRRLLHRQKIQTQPEKPQSIYLPSLYTQYIDPQAGLLVYKRLAAKQPVLLLGQATGWFEYMYGNRTRCLQIAKKVLLTWEKYSIQRPLPLITDSIELYSFLKNYPLLFDKIPGWKQRAQTFAKHIQFITDLPFSSGEKNRNQRIALDTSSVLYPATEPAERAQKILSALYGKNLLQCAYSAVPLPAASIGFASDSNTAILLHKNIRDIARQQIDTVYCLSAWSALELNAVLPLKYPSAQAQFFIYAGADE